VVRHKSEWKSALTAKTTVKNPVEYISLFSVGLKNNEIAEVVKLHSNNFMYNSQCLSFPIYGSHKSLYRYRNVHVFYYSTPAAMSLRDA
jgi:hypothetical protein